MENYLETILKPLISEPDSLKITQTNDAMGVLLSVDLHKADMGGIIGKAGETAKSIRTIMRVFGSKNQSRVSVRFLEPAGGKFSK